jgi:hypothetical protein
MADDVTTQIIENLPNQRRRTYIFTNHSDGTGESAVQKIDISDLPTTKHDPSAPTKIRILSAFVFSTGLQVKVSFDHDTDDTALILCHSYGYDFTTKGGIPDPASAGGTGDLLFTTINHSANDSYTVIMEIGW